MKFSDFITSIQFSDDVESQFFPEFVQTSNQIQLRNRQIGVNLLIEWLIHVAQIPTISESETKTVKICNNDNWLC